MQDNKIYYEGFDWEKAALSDKLDSKIHSILNIIPKDVKSIVDIGCGDGTITRRLAEHFQVFAVDRSRNALNYVPTEKIQASADYIPLKTKSIDMIFSSEMLEHLPENIFFSSISEFKRIARKYIFLTFPNDENIQKNLVRCINCKIDFNKSYHLRNLNEQKIVKLFSDFKIVSTFHTGSLIRPYNKFLSILKHRYSPSNSWIPPNWTPDKRRSTVCPNCNTSFDIPYKFNLLSFLLDSINTVISPKRHYQICLLLERKNDS